MEGPSSRLIHASNVTGSVSFQSLAGIGIRLRPRHRLGPLFALLKCENSKQEIKKKRRRHENQDECKGGLENRRVVMKPAMTTG
jgi:hypothetical protein